MIPKREVSVRRKGSKAEAGASGQCYKIERNTTVRISVIVLFTVDVHNRQNTVSVRVRLPTCASKGCFRKEDVQGLHLRPEFEGLLLSATVVANQQLPQVHHGAAAQLLLVDWFKPPLIMANTSARYYKQPGGTDVHACSSK